VIPLKPAEVRIDGSSWWVAADVCRILGHSNSRVPIKRLDDDAKGVLTAHTLGGKQVYVTINEPGSTR
jgi:anti-repressor protein